MVIREATVGDEPVVARLVRALAEGEGETSPVDDRAVATYLDFPGSGAFVAEVDGAVVGVLTWFMRPGLFHGGRWACIDELFVEEGARHQGVGDALVAGALQAFRAAGCREVTVSTMPGNHAARHLYAKHGLTDESLQLERHF